MVCGALCAPTFVVVWLSCVCETAICVLACVRTVFWRDLSWTTPCFGECHCVEPAHVQLSRCTRIPWFVHLLSALIDHPSDAGFKSGCCKSSCADDVSALQCMSPPFHLCASGEQVRKQWDPANRMDPAEYHHDGHGHSGGACGRFGWGWRP